MKRILTHAEIDDRIRGMADRIKLKFTEPEILVYPVIV